jgi:predicted Co/Zn/Cd cation transporter (cation efflux family)
MMRTEQQALKISLVGILIVSALGIGLGALSGSFAILFDGVFSLVDAVMSIVSITVAGLIARSASNALSKRAQDRFTMGFWHFEPFVLAVNALLMMAVTAYGLFQAVSALLTGGRDVEFGPAVVYAAVVVVLITVIGAVEHRANKRIGSALVAMDVKGWIISGGVTGALLVAFLIGMLIEGTDLAWAMPYVDPTVLTIVTLVLLPVPLSTLRTSLAEIFLVTPPELRERAEEAAGKIVESEGFTDFRVYASQQGRASTVEVIFHVPPALGNRSLEEWDRIREETEAQLDGGDPNNWITVSFTSRTPPMLPHH